MENLERIAYQLRKDTLDIIMAGGGGHIGGDMSVMETLVALYFREMNILPENQNDPDRDYFILSKGHSVEAYYAVLCARGFLDLEDVKKRFSKFGSPYIGHPNNKLAGMEMNSGSLGHGLPVAVGLALGNRMSGRTNRTYVVMGDGELAEGSVWEGFMSGHMYGLDNLCAVIDRNHLQISGNTEDVMAQEVLKDRVKRGRQRRRSDDRRIRRGEADQGAAHLHHREHRQGQGIAGHGEQGVVAPPRPDTGRIRRNSKGSGRTPRGPRLSGNCP